MKKILVPFDFSDPATAALELAIDMAKRNKFALSVLYIIPDAFAVQNKSRSTKSSDSGNTNVRKFLDGIKAESMLNLKEVLKKYKSPGLKFTPKVEFSASVYQGILKALARQENAFAVMGTHGASNIAERFIGTNTERVFRMTKKPVIIVREKAADYNFKKIVFATNLEVPYKKVFGNAWGFIKSYNADIDILRVNTVKDSIRGSYGIGLMKSLSRGYKGKFDFVLTDAETPEEGINNYCVKSKADLLVMGVHRKKGFKRLFTDRISETISRTVKIPVLTIDI